MKFEYCTKEIWMDGTHSFDDVEKLFAETGLDTLTTIDVRVGMTSMRNKERGKGLRTEPEQRTVDWLLNRRKTAPKGIKTPPRMLKELGN
ncbi:hypothetical protein ACEQ8H_005392 [Pleosporales sp. CAS-2024a]